MSNVHGRSAPPTNRLEFAAGTVFGDRTVVGISDQRRKGSAMWILRCKCGDESAVVACAIARTKSCAACSRSKRRGTRRHDSRVSLKRHPLYQTWRAMIRRCRDAKRKDFAKYGGRGISVHERWLDLMAFAADMGPKPSPLHSIERVDNSRGYEPGNCKWATTLEQCRNTRRNVFLEHAGERLTVSEWARRIGVRPCVIFGRINSLGWTVSDAVSTPARRKKPHAE